MHAHAHVRSFLGFPFCVASLCWSLLFVCIIFHSSAVLLTISCIGKNGGTLRLPCVQQKLAIFSLPTRKAFLRFRQNMNRAFFPSSLPCICNAHSSRKFSCNHIFLLITWPHFIWACLLQIQKSPISGLSFQNLSTTRPVFKNFCTQVLALACKRVTRMNGIAVLFRIQLRFSVRVIQCVTRLVKMDPPDCWPFSLSRVGSSCRVVRECGTSFPASQHRCGGCTIWCHGRT